MAKEMSSQNNAKLRDIFFQNLSEVLTKYAEVSLDEEISDDTLLQDFGLDSVAFSNLVSLLERDTGILPEQILDGTYFPNTVAEFLALYEDAS